MSRIRGDLSLPLIASVCDIARRCLIVCNPSLRLMFNAPSEGDGDLPLVTLHFLRDFLGILTELTQVCWIVACHAPLFIGDFSLEVSSHLK